MPPQVHSKGKVQQLQGIASAPLFPHSGVLRGQIVQACGAGESDTAFTRRMGLTGTTVSKLRERIRELWGSRIYTTS